MLEVKPCKLKEFVSVWHLFFDEIGGWLSHSLPFLPDFPYKNLILTLSLASVCGGILFVAWQVFPLFFTGLSPKEKLEKAENLLQKGKLEKAKKLYLSLKAYTKAAQIAQRLGQLEEAASLATKAGDHLFSAQLLAMQSRHSEAAVVFERLNRPQEAAEQWEKAGNLEQSLAKYKVAGDFEKGLQILSRMQRWEELAELCAREFQRRNAKLGVNPPLKKAKEVHNLASQAGEAYSKAGNFFKASEIFVAAGMLERAAQCLEQGNDSVGAGDLYVQAGKLEEAARVFVQAEKFEQAVDLYQELGQHDKVAHLLVRAGKVKEASIVEAETALKDNNLSKAAELFAEGGKYSEAAEIFLKLGDYSRAADCWVALGDHATAADAYEIVGEFSNAALQYIQNGQFEKAAVCYEKLGLFEQAISQYQAAKNFFDAGRLMEKIHRDQAIALFQKVPKDDPHYWEAQYNLGRIFWRKGLHDLAGEKYSQVCENVKMEKKFLPAFYDYAIYLEQVHELAKAHRILKDVLATDFHFQDTLDRIARIEKKLKESDSQKTRLEPAPS